jgi:hypothetical protein
MQYTVLLKIERWKLNIDYYASLQFSGFPSAAAER